MKVSETVQPPAGVLQTGQPKRSVIGSVKWTVLSEIVSRAFPPLVTIILARILIPEDYGVVGVAAMVLSLLNVVWEAGLGRALIQTEFDINKSANCVFWSNLAVGTFVYLLVFTAAPWVGIIYHDTRISSVLRVLSLNLIIGALTTVQTALLQRELRFKEIFWSRFYSSFIWKKTWPQWLACFLMAVVVTAGKTWLWPCAANGHKGIGPLMLSTLTGVLVYVGTTWWVDRPFFQEMNGLLYRAVKRERTSEGNK